MTSYVRIVTVWFLIHSSFNALFSLGFLLRSTTKIRTSFPRRLLIHRSVMTRGEQSQRADDAVIVGGGPAGLLCAICLAQKSEGAFKISVYDRQPPPPLPTDDKEWSDFSRHYLIGLGGRGIVALQAFGVWEDVKDYSVLVPGRQDWSPGSKEPVEKFLTDRKYGTYVLQRDKLVSVLRQHIVDNYKGQIQLFNQHDVQPVDFFGPHGNEVILNIANATAAKMQQPAGFQRISSRIVVAADGAARVFANKIEIEDREKNLDDPFSVVRFEDGNQRVFKMIPFRLPSDWRKDLNYAVRSSNDRIVFDALPANDRGDFVGNLLFRKDDAMAQPIDPYVFRKFLDDVLPQFSPLFDDDTVRTVAECPPSPLPMFRYIKPRMHHGMHCVLLGDCAHTVKPYFGLGCNSALEDVKVSVHSADVPGTFVLI